MPAWRCDPASDLGRHQRCALDLDVPSLMVLAFDPSIDVAICDELGKQSVMRT